MGSVLRYARTLAGAASEESRGVRQCAITVPPYFSPAARQVRSAVFCVCLLDCVCCIVFVIFCWCCGEEVEERD